MSAVHKGRCCVCACRYPLRKSGLIVDHQRSGTYAYCDGGGRLPIDPATEPTWEARALDWEIRALHAEKALEEAEAVLERIRLLPVQSGGVVRSSDLARAMGDA